MIGGNETIGETGQGKIATGIVLADTRTAEGVLRMSMNDGTPVLSLPVVLPMGHLVPEGRLIPIEKRASELIFTNMLIIRGFDTHTHRISPHPLRGSSPVPTRTPTTSESKPPLTTLVLHHTPPQPEPELELATSPVPVEVTLAARRAKRQAILAKYTGVASVNTTEASPSPGPSSAVQPPPPSAVVSDPQSQRHSFVGENGAGSISRDPSADPSSEHPVVFFPSYTP
jgi:hypothetical protein